MLDGLNRYAYCGNNPVNYTDPSGHFITALFTGGTTIWLDAMLWGAALGGYSGYKIGEANGANGWELAGYTFGGALIGGVAGLAGSAVAASGIPLANTLGIVTGSAINSGGMYALSGCKTNFSISFGIGNYNFSKGDLSFLFDGNNEWYEYLGYAFGALANLQDIVSLFGGGVNVDAITEKDDPISHAAVVNDKEGIDVSVGPKGGGYFDKNQDIAGKIKNMFKDVEGSTWPNHATDGHGAKYPIFNVNKNILKYCSDQIIKGNNFIGGSLRYQAIGFSCVSYASRALWLAGIPNLGLHPYLWQLSLAFRQSGIFASPFLIDDLN